MGMCHATYGNITFLEQVPRNVHPLFNTKSEIVFVKAAVSLAKRETCVKIQFFQFLVSERPIIFSGMFWRPCPLPSPKTHHGNPATARWCAARHRWSSRWTNWPWYRPPGDGIAQERGTYSYLRKPFCLVTFQIIVREIIDSQGWHSKCFLLFFWSFLGYVSNKNATPQLRYRDTVTE